MTSPHDLTLSQAQRQIQDGTLSSVDLMTSVLDRIPLIPAEHNPFVMVRDRERLLAEAATADAARANGLRLGPLHGIPVAIKDIVDVAGIPTKCGSQSMADAAPAEANAPVVNSFLRAGAIVVGKTVTQEFAAGTISAPSRNPWDLDRIPGGSSGGSAAAVAAGMSLLAVGTDTGGSIRCPASVCGVTGLKPTYGSVSRRGVFRSPGRSIPSVQSLARSTTARSRSMPFPAMIPPIPAPPMSFTPLPLPKSACRSKGSASAHPPVLLRSARTRTRRDLRYRHRYPPRLGAEIVEEDWDLAREARFTALAINRVETAAVHEHRVRAGVTGIAEELRMRIKGGLIARPRSIPVPTRPGSWSGTRLPATSPTTIWTPCSFRCLWTAARSDNPVLTYSNGEQESVLSAYTALNMPFNATGQPALAIPVGFTANGLPIGMQIVGRPFAEARICRIGHAYESATKWIDRRPSLKYGDNHG